MKDFISGLAFLKEKKKKLKFYYKFDIPNIFKAAYLKLLKFVESKISLKT